MLRMTMTMVLDEGEEQPLPPPSPQIGKDPSHPSVETMMIPIYRSSLDSSVLHTFCGWYSCSGGGNSNVGCSRDVPVVVVVAATTTTSGHEK
jgi:hypothetical protein